jgi:hypothetical protein
MDNMCPLTSTEDREFEPRSRQTINYAIGICCFSAKHAAFVQRLVVYGQILRNVSGLTDTHADVVSMTYN